MSIAADWRNGLRRVWRALSRLRLGVILLGCVLGATVIGTLLPQAPADAGPDWWDAVRARYGALYSPLRALGLFDLFATPWFWALLGLLLLSTLACFLTRVRPLGRAVLAPRIQFPDAQFETAALRASLAFASPSTAQKALKTTLQRRRYRVRVEQTEGRCDLRADRHHVARLGTLLTHLGLVGLLLGAAGGSLWGWREPALPVRSEQMTPVGHGTGVRVRCDGFAILRTADGTPRQYQAELVLLDSDGTLLQSGTVQVNHPLRHGGVRYYLQSYRLTEAACDVTLKVVHDPGYVPVIVAGLCLLVGMTLTFHLPHRRIWARVTATGQTALLGRTHWDRRRFARQFEHLVQELEQATARGTGEKRGR